MLRDQWKTLGVTTKEAAEQAASKFRREWEAEQMGILPPKSLREGAKRPLSEHLEDYLSDLERRGKTGRKGKGIKQTRTRLKRLFRECGWQVPANMTADSFVSWRSRQRKLKASTLNHFRNDAITFLNWLVRNERIARNPLNCVTKIEVNDDERRTKRAFSDEELVKLFMVAPEYRRIAYMTAAFTGLRFQELQQLEWGDVILDGERSRLKVRASTTKNGKGATIPLMAVLEQALKDYRPPDPKPTDKVFRKGVPRSRTLKVDLEAADIPYDDERGHVAVFHSFRKTWGTLLHRGGIDERSAMSLMRHSDRRLTNVVYADTALMPLQKSVRDLSASPLVTHICAQISGKSGQNLSEGGNKKTSGGVSEVVESEQPSQAPSPSVNGGQLVEVAGVEPASLVSSHAASTCLASALLSSPDRPKAG